jgi:hypothetical protein
MGNDKLARIGATGARYVVSGDMSCLMHPKGARSASAKTSISCTWPRC